MVGDEYLELADWRRQVASLFGAWRSASARDPGAATLAFRAAKERLFAEHPQSPLRADERAAGRGLDHWPYDPTYRMTLRLEPVDGLVGPHDEEGVGQPGAGQPGAARQPGGSSRTPLALPSSGPGALRFRRVGRVRLEGPLAGRDLTVFWIDAYGGGLFLPFRDETSGQETYGAGRYLLDTIKGADHGGDMTASTLVLDLNMAYHPSCAYDPRWSCPLAPPENILDLAVPAGERLLNSG